ncbi:MAG: hypothetical protein JKY65_20670 [Planctomycetes bacterium]|nr:hypothetical protein [Planctomycetota bacterium]
MTQPRRLRKDQTHTVCRRTTGRIFFLKPTPKTNQVLEYALVLACSRHHPEVEVSGFASISNHYHNNLRDRVGGAKSKVPKFFADFNSLVARALNAQFGRGGALWDGGSYDNVEVHGYDATIAQWVYVAGQAVAAGLVERPEDWPGLTWLPEDIGTTKRVRRPDHAFFGSTSRRDLSENPWVDLRAEVRAEELSKRRAESDRKRGRTRKRRKQLAKERDRREKRASESEPVNTSTLPEWVTYTIPAPEGLQEMEIEDARVILRQALDDYVAAIHEQRAREGLGFLGVARVMEQSPYEAAGDSWPSFGRNPRIACTGMPKADRLKLYDELIQWRLDHRKGVEQLREGSPWRARFPRGAHRRTKELRRILAARRQPPPLAA